MCIVQLVFYHILLHLFMLDFIYCIPYFNIVYCVVEQYSCYWKNTTCLAYSLYI